MALSSEILSTKSLRTSRVALRLRTGLTSLPGSGLVAGVGGALSGLRPSHTRCSGVSRYEASALGELDA